MKKYNPDIFFNSLIRLAQNMYVIFTYTQYIGLSLFTHVDILEKYKQSNLYSTVTFNTRNSDSINHACIQRSPLIQGIVIA